MEQALARKVAAALKVDVSLVVREYWEIHVLKELSDSEAGRHLVFKGGTALRLAYGSPRFSEDLDFSLSKDTLAGRFDLLAKKLAGRLPGAALTDLAEKRYTYLCELKFSPPYLAMPFRLKIECSRRAIGAYKRELRLLGSPDVAPLQVLFPVATLEQILADKLLCLRERSAPKDRFDLWYVSQVLKRPWTRPDTSIDKRVLRRDLRKYLPPKFWDVIEGLA